MKQHSHAVVVFLGARGWELGVAKSVTASLIEEVRRAGGYARAFRKTPTNREIGECVLAAGRAMGLDDTSVVTAALSASKLADDEVQP